MTDRISFFPTKGRENIQDSWRVLGQFSKLSNNFEEVFSFGKSWSRMQKFFEFLKPRSRAPENFYAKFSGAESWFSNHNSAPEICVKFQVLFKFRGFLRKFPGIFSILDQKAKEKFENFPFASWCWKGAFFEKSSGIFSKNSTKSREIKNQKFFISHMRSCVSNFWNFEKFQKLSK